jgi:hypothetical protein
MLLGDWRESGFLFVPLPTALAGLASAQCPQNDGQVTGGLKTYPLASDRGSTPAKRGGSGLSFCYF